MTPPVLIALHGALATAAQFDEFLAQPGVPHFIPVNLPGHGGVPCVTEFSSELFATAVLDQITESGAAQADLFGYSMGGYIALWTAWKYPEKIRSITILNTKLDWTPETAARMAGMFDTEKIISKAPQMAEALAKAHAPGDWITVAQKTARFLLGLGNGDAIPEAGFRSISCPVRMLRGALDNVVTEAESLAIAGLIPYCTYAEMPDSKHAFEQVNLPALVQILQNKH